MDEKTRNRRLAVASTQAEQDMIQQSHVTSLARARRRRRQSQRGERFLQLFVFSSQMEDAANKAEERASIAATVAATRDAEAKAAAGRPRRRRRRRHRAGAARAGGVAGESGGEEARAPRRT